MKLFTMDELTGDVKVNVPWIKLLPEFNNLFDKRMKNKKSSYESDILGVKRLTYIYFMMDFSSPIADWEQDKKHTEALNYTGLTDTDIDVDCVRLALSKYEELQYNACRPLKTYRAALRGLEAMDSYLEEVDFTKTDKQGKLLYTPNQFTTNMSTINKAYDELAKLRKRIDEELSNSTSIRGSATMGDKEMKFGKVDNTWTEGGDEFESSPEFKDLGDILSIKTK